MADNREWDSDQEDDGPVYDARRWPGYPATGAADPRPRAAVVDSVHKTRLCPAWMHTDRCPHASRCHFAHGPKDLAPHQAKVFKTQLCRFFEREGKCRDGLGCPYAHGEHELRPRNSAQRRCVLETDDADGFADRSTVPSESPPRYRRSLDASPVASSSAAADRPDPRSRILFRARICKDLQQSGTCHYGENCKFSHRSEEFPRMSGTQYRDKTSTTHKTWVCHKREKLGRCFRGSKSYEAHSEEELPTHQDGASLGGTRPRRSEEPPAPRHPQPSLSPQRKRPPSRSRDNMDGKKVRRREESVISDRHSSSDPRRGGTGHHARGVDTDTRTAKRRRHSSSPGPFASKRRNEPTNPPEEYADPPDPPLGFPQRPESLRSASPARPHTLRPAPPTATAVEGFEDRSAPPSPLEDSPPPSWLPRPDDPPPYDDLVAPEPPLPTAAETIPPEDLDFLYEDVPLPSAFPTNPPLHPIPNQFPATPQLPGFILTPVPAAPQPVPRPRFCAECGERIHVPGQFCAECGHPFPILLPTV